MPEVRSFYKNPEDSVICSAIVFNDNKSEHIHFEMKGNTALVISSYLHNASIKPLIAGVFRFEEVEEIVFSCSGMTELEVMMLVSEGFNQDKENLKLILKK